MTEGSCGHTPYDRDQVPGCIICAQAEIERLRQELEAYKAHPPLLVDGVTGKVTPLFDAAAMQIELDRLREELAIARATSMGPIQHYVERLRAVAIAARALVQTAQSLHGALNHSQQIVSEHKLTALESALEAAGYGMTEEEFERGVTEETTPSLSCPTCGLLYSGRGGQKGMPVRLSCPNGHEWNDPRGGCNS